MRKKGEGKTKLKCKFCGKEFEVLICHLNKKGSGQFCSKKCYNSSMERKIIMKCQYCGKGFKTWPCRIGAKKFCSRKCYADSMRGKPGKIKGEKHYAWEGGRYKNSYGYWILNINRLKGKDYELAKEMAWKGNKITILEHRFLIAKKIGRPLTKNEVVHHKNGIKDDNRIENLELLSLSTHSKGNLPYNSIGICPKCGHSDIIENFLRNQPPS